MAVDESLGALSSVAVSNTPAGTDTVGPDLDDHLRDIKKNIRRAAETSQGPTAPTGFIGRQRLATSATGSNTLTHQMHDGSAYRSLYDLDTSAGTVSRWYARKGSMPGAAMSGTLSGVAVIASTFHGSASASGTFVGQVNLKDGSSANPSLAFDGDSNTGLFRSGSDALVVVTGAAKRLKFESDGAFTGPQLGGWENLHAETISTDASVEFSDAELGASTYEQICFVLKSVLLTNDNTALALQVSTNGGSTWLATSYQYALTGIAAVSPASSIDRQIQDDSEINLVTAADNSADRGISGHIYWLNPGATTERPVFMWDLTYTHTEASNQIVRVIGSGSHDVSETANAVRFGDTANMGTDTVASGTIRAYGLRNA